MFQILHGTAAIEVDFKSYFDWADKIIFLEKGQYIKFLSSDFLVRQIAFPQQEIFQHKDVRVLFKHLVSLGYINYLECEACQTYLSETILHDPIDIIDVSSKQWFWQNPFGAQKDEYHIIFDIKDIIDTSYKNHLSNKELTNLLGKQSIQAHALYANKVGLTIKKSLAHKRMTETKKEIAFSDKSIKEISYEYGYKDPAYFNRVFKKNTGITPDDFRKEISYAERDHFSKILFELLHEFHQEHRAVGFYADKMHLSPKALSKKVKDKLQTTIGQLIRDQINQSSKTLLQEGFPVHEVAYKLGFSEANHFSSFFKKLNNISPSHYQSQKVQ